jgi:hydrogenase maturation factor
MKLVFGEIVEISAEEGVRQGTIRVGGAMRKVVLDLTPGVVRSDHVLLCDGVALGKVEEDPNPEPPHVPRDSR